MSRPRILSSPLDGLDEEQINAAKALWAPKYAQWEKERLNRHEQEMEKEVEKMALGNVKGKVEEEKGLYSLDEPDPFDKIHATSLENERRFLQLTEAVKNNDTADDIIDSYARADSTSKDTILYSVRTKLAKALILRKKIHGIEHDVCTELESFLTQASSDEQEVNDAIHAGKGTTASLDQFLWRPWSSAWVSEAIGAWESIDTERSQGLDALRNTIVMLDVEGEKDEKGNNKAGDEEGDGKGCGEGKGRCSS